jgi:hypothetical protein
MYDAGLPKKLVSLNYPTLVAAQLKVEFIIK